MRTKLLLFIIAASFIGFFGQDLSAQSGSKIDSLSKQLDRLQDRLSKIEKGAQEEKQKDTLGDLLKKAKTMSKEKKADLSKTKKFHSGLRQQSALNPNISMGGEFYFVSGKSESDLNRLPSDTEWGTGQLFMREVELGIESALDPFSRGKVFIGFDGEEVSVEEAYITWLNCPLNMNLKLGEYKAQFGKLNRYHDHAMPQFDRPRALVQLFGNESLSGVGLSGNFMIPYLWADVNELDLEIVTGGNGFSFTNEGRSNFIYMMHLKNYFDLNRSTYIEVGFSGAAGKNDAEEQHETWIAGTDITVKWQPPGRSKYSGLEWLTECFISNRENTHHRSGTWGGYTSIQVRTGARTLVSGRLDYTQLPWNNDLWERGGALALDYWQSEFVFLRLQYTYIDRNFNESDQRFILHTCWAMGSHKHEAY